MGTNKPPTPHVPYFSTQVYATVVVCAATVVYGAFNIGNDPGDLPMTNWLWFLIWAGVFVALYVRMRMIKKRVEPVWKCPGIRPWSDPLQNVDGSKVEFMAWYVCSSGLSVTEATEALQDPARLHQVQNGYRQYEQRFESTYGYRR